MKFDDMKIITNDMSPESQEYIKSLFEHCRSLSKVHIGPYIEACKLVNVPTEIAYFMLLHLSAANFAFSLSSKSAVDGTIPKEELITWFSKILDVMKQAGIDEIAKGFADDE